MEVKLKQYRTIEKRKLLFVKLKSYVFDIINTVGRKEDQNISNPSNTDPHASERSFDTSDFLTENLNWKQLLLFTMLWIITLIFFIYIQFGSVFFALSFLLFMYFNTRTRPPLPGEVSAYSVFNHQCEALLGTLKAEDIDRELRHGKL